MEKFARSFFSMRMMALSMIVFLMAIAIATFLESAYDIDTARIIVYNALWFELLLVYLGINLIANIIRYKMWGREKIAMFMFHISFIVILLGAGITRYFSFEGMMLIREGESSDVIFSAEANLWYKVNDGKLQYTDYHAMMMTDHSLVSNDFEKNFAFPEHDNQISISYVDYKKNMIDSLVTNDSISQVSLEIVAGGMKSQYLTEGEFLMLGDIAMSFEKENSMPGIDVFRKGNKVMLKTQHPMRYLPMPQMTKENRQTGVADSLYQVIPMDTLVAFQTGMLYQVGEQQFVFKSVKKHTKKVRLQAEKKNTGSTYLTVKLTDGEKSKIVELEGGQGVIPNHVVFNFAGLTYEMEYGARRMKVPFSIECRDFQLDKYPGSDMASSFASEVTIIDEENNLRKEQRIFMNNVLDYGGYRFFQSSYDPDEKGTRLSVNHDWWGTNITYLGYLIMAIGMVFSLFSANGRFRDLARMLTKISDKKMKYYSIFIGFAFLSFGVSAQHDHSDHDGHDHSSHETNTEVQDLASEKKKEITFEIMSKEHSEEVESLLVQDIKGRIIPLHSLADQLLRKLNRSKIYEGNNAVQTIMSMHMYQEHWANQKVIYVSYKSELREKLGMDGKYISYNDLIDENDNFKLTDDYEIAHQRKDVDRGEYDKKLIKLVERFQVIQQIFNWNYMRIIPVKNDPNNTWVDPMMMAFKGNDSVATMKGLNYLQNLSNASKTGQYEKAEFYLKELKEFQREVSKEVVPSEGDVEREIKFTENDIFGTAKNVYLYGGCLLLLTFFIKIFVNAKSKVQSGIKLLVKVLIGFIALGFIYHGYGVYLRAMISGHAPWSNGYEAVIFIAWVSMLFGLLFSPKNAVIVAGAAILAFLMIFVTEMNLMDPEITPLQPVLKSYWLMIHVAIITGSYGPLGISFILGMLNLVLYIFRNKNNGKIVSLNISELRYVSEMSMTIGLFMLTIGTFLGGIWANESWGRYWGWDPKETWALVAVLVYAVILHLRYIPALKGKFLFSVVSMWGYVSILFTFFGVNFWLTGLHSYAQGEGLKRLPMWVIYTILVFVVFTVIAAIRNAQYKRMMNNELME